MSLFVFTDGGLPIHAFGTRQISRTHRSIFQALEQFVSEKNGKLVRATTPSAEFFWDMFPLPSTNLLFVLILSNEVVDEQYALRMMGRLFQAMVRACERGGESRIRKEILLAPRHFQAMVRAENNKK